MCKYCGHEQEIMGKSIVEDWIFQFVDKVSKDKITYSRLSIFIDRGYLRMVDKEESQCLDHGRKIEIKYCPFCGDKLN